MTSTVHVYEIRPRKDHRGVDLIPMRCHSVACGTANQTQSVTRRFAAGQIMPVIRVYDAAGNMIETHEHAGDFKEP
jgi:hypothetical protein